MINIEEIKGIQNTIEELVNKLQALKEGVVLEVSTHSISQDALRAGFQSTCAEGIATLFGIKDMTVEACKDFYPRHLKEVEKGEKHLTEKYQKYCDDYVQETKSEAIQRTPWYKLLTLWKLANMVTPKPTFTITKTEPKLNIPDGRIVTNWEVVVNYNDGGTDTKKDNTTRSHDHTTITVAKRGMVSYEPYTLYNKSYIPDEAIDVIKEALAIGLTDIQVAFPIIGDGKPANSDPIIVGYNKTEKRQDMYMLAWFGYDTKQPMACNI